MAETEQQGQERAAGMWRVGRKVGRTIYVQVGDQPSDNDPLIGVMDTPDLAAIVVRSVNASHAFDRPVWADAVIDLLSDAHDDVRHTDETVGELVRFTIRDQLNQAARLDPRILGGKASDAR